MDEHNLKYPIKPPLTFDEQIELLKSRNLIIEDVDFAKTVLSHLNYYRLSGYSLSLRKNDVFNQGVTFNTIWQIYQFDKKLRYLLLDLIEIVEISFRTHIAYYLAHTYGPLCYQDSDHFTSKAHHKNFLSELQCEINRNKNKELFIKHHIIKYGGNFPIWVAVEILSFGSLSRLYSNMKNKDKDAISRKYYNFPYTYITTWLHSLVILRNICAHYGRLYNRRFTATPKIGKRDKQLGIQSDKLFASIFILKYLIKDGKKWTNFVTNLQALIEEFNVIDISLIGFPENWVTLLKE